MGHGSREREVTALAVHVRSSLPHWVSRKFLTRASVRSFRSRIGMYSALDTPYLQLRPPSASDAEHVGPPDFIGIGAQKAGTSWWFDLMIKHPAIYHRPTMEMNKERQFFSHFALEEFTSQEANQYNKWFPRVAGTITGEWTPDYLYYSWVAEMAFQIAPTSKILVLLRDPVDRFMSGVAHLAGLNEGRLPDGHIMQEAFDRGLYARQLQLWVDLYSREDVLVLQYEQCVSQPVAELSKTFAFLGVDDTFVPPGLDQIVNPSRRPKPKTSSAVQKRLARLYAHDVSDLQSIVPSLDLDLWPHFADVGIT